MALPLPLRLAGRAHHLAARRANVCLTASTTVRDGYCHLAYPSDVAARVLCKLCERAVFDLAHSLARDSHRRADLLESHPGRVLVYGAACGGVGFPFKVGPRVGYRRWRATAALGNLDRGLDEWGSADSVSHAESSSSGPHVGTRGRGCTER
jgi:hypothetical protein